ncbi:MAG TPA: hypothetical protein VGA09_14780 [Candidatus Binatia bacterium]
MTFKIQVLAHRMNLATVVILAVCGIFLATSPLHPLPGDSHGGYLAMFSGLSLLTLALVTYIAGQLLCRRPGWGGIVEAIVSILVFSTILVLAIN